MRIAITTPTGNIGSKITEMLLADGDHELVLLARNPEKVADAKARGAEVEQGDLTDRSFVIRATQNVDSLFWLNPPSFASDDFPAYYEDLAGSACDAIKANGIRHVVFLSSIGAHLGKGVGPVNAFLKPEQMFREIAENLAILRPGYFMENLFEFLPMIQTQKSVFAPMRPEASTPMIATHDIAASASKLLSQPLTGQKVVPLHGPRDYSMGQFAEVVSRALGEKINYVQVTADQTREAMVSMGLTKYVADLFLELYDAIDTGRIQPEFPRSAETTTPTTLEEFVNAAMVPALQTA